MYGSIPDAPLSIDSSIENDKNEDAFDEMSPERQLHKTQHQNRLVMTTELGMKSADGRAAGATS